jgi:hypothetical protein
MLLMVNTVELVAQEDETAAASTAMIRSMILRDLSTQGTSTT